MPVKLDMYERKILELLQSDASLSTAAIAEKVGLSPSPCWRRIDRLEKDGFIKCKVAIVDRHKVGLRAQIFAQIKLNCCLVGDQIDHAIANTSCQLSPARLTI